MSVDTKDKKPKKITAKKTIGGETKAPTAPAKAKATKATAGKAAAPKAAGAVAKKATAPSSEQRTHVPSHEEVALLAHRFFEERQKQHGFHEQDWLRAEQELLKVS